MLNSSLEATTVDSACCQRVLVASVLVAIHLLTEWRASSFCVRSSLAMKLFRMATKLGWGSDQYEAVSIREPGRNALLEVMSLKLTAADNVALWVGAGGSGNRCREGICEE